MAKDSNKAGKKSASKGSPRKKRRGCGCLLTVLIVLLVILGGAVLGAKLYIGSDGGRGLITGTIESFVGLPASIDAIEVKLLSSPLLAVRGVAVGEGDFKAELTSLTVDLRLLALPLFTIDVPSVNIAGLVVTLPESDEELMRRINEVVAQFAGEEGEEAAPAPPAEVPSEGGPFRVAGFAIRVGRASMPGALVKRGAQPAARCDLEALGLLTDAMSGKVDLALPYFHEDTRLTVRMKSDMSSALPRALDAEVSLHNLDLEAVLKDENVPHARVSFDATITGDVPDTLAVALKGHVETEFSAAFTGDFGAQVQWRDSTLTVEEVKIDTPGVQFAAEAKVGSAGDILLRVPSAKATPEGLRIVCALIPLEGFRFTARNDAHLAISHFEFGMTEGGGMRLADGSVSLGGIDLRLEDGTVAFGGIGAEITVADNTLHVAKLGSDDVYLSGDVKPDMSTGAVALDLKALAKLSREKLAPVLPLDTVKTLNGTVAVERFTGTFTPGGKLPPDDLVAAVRLQKINISVDAPQLPEPLVCKNLNGALDFAKGTLKIGEVAAEGFTINGTLRPDFETLATALDLKLEVDLGSALVAAAVPGGMVRGLGGALFVERITATVLPEPAIPKDLVIEGALKNGRAQVTVPGFEDSLSDLSATFTTDGKTLTASLGVNSKRMGALSCEARYELDRQTATAVFSVDVARAAQSFLPEGQARDYGAAALKAYGASTFDITAQLPSADAPRAAVSVMRRGDPPLSLKAELASKDGSYTLETASCSTDLPLASLAGALPDRVTVSGVAKLAFDAAPARFEARAVLDDAAFSLAEYVEKKRGAALSVKVLGGTPDNAFAPQSATVTVLGETIQIDLSSGMPRIPKLDFNLGVLTAILSKGAKASGRVTGSIDTDPLEVALRLDKAGFALAPEVAIDSITGDVSYKDNMVVAKNLRVLGADSDCTINADYKGDQFEAAVSGAKLNLNALQSMYDAAMEIVGGAPADDDAMQEPAPAKPAAPSPPAPAHAGAAPGASAPPLTGTAKVDVGSVYYRRGELKDLHMLVAMKPEGIFVDRLSFRAYDGTMDGQVQMLYGKGAAPNTVNVKTTLANLDLRIIDDVVVEKPMGLFGTSNGAIVMALPLAETTEAMIAGMDGAVDVTLADGSFGQLSYATRLLDMLKGLEIFAITKPSWNKGLTFNSVVCSTKITKGVALIKEVTLEDTMYAIEGGGTVDLPSDAVDITLVVSPLQLVKETVKNVTKPVKTIVGVLGDLAGIVPGVDKVVSEIEKVTDKVTDEATKLRRKAKVAICVSGPPSDPLKMNYTICTAARLDKLREGPGQTDGETAVPPAATEPPTPETAAAVPAGEPPAAETAAAALATESPAADTAAAAPIAESAEPAAPAETAAPQTAQPAPKPLSPKEQRQDRRRRLIGGVLDAITTEESKEEGEK